MSFIENTNFKPPLNYKMCKEFLLDDSYMVYLHSNGIYQSGIYIDSGWYVMIFAGKFDLYELTNAGYENLIDSFSDIETAARYAVKNLI